MSVKLNTQIKKFFRLNKSEQRGIILLVVLIFIVVIINMLLPYFVESKSKGNLIKYNDSIELFISEQKPLADSAHIAFMQNSGDIDMALAMQKIKPFKFNPNKLPSEIWKKMGFTKKQIRNIKNYEAKGGKFNRKEDVKKMYSISDVEYEIIEPFIVIPSSYKSDNGRVVKKKRTVKITYKSVEVNSAQAPEFISSLGITTWLAKRIVSYGNVLGGYYNKNQLKEVYGLDDSIFNIIEKYINIDTTLIKKIDINNIDFKNLLRHPYFDYNTTKLTLTTRKKVGSFSSISQLGLIDGISDSTVNKVRPYLYFRPN